MNQPMATKDHARSDLISLKSGRCHRIMICALVTAAALGLFSRGVLAGSDPALNQQLLEAAKRGDLALVKSLLDKGADLNAKDAGGRTVLMFAA
jgi:ankyrin repeat protein